MDGNPSWRSISVAARVLALSALLSLAVSACAGVVGTVEVEPQSPGALPTTSEASSVSTAYPAPRLTSDADRESRQGTAAAVGLLTPVSAVDMVTFTNPVLGLSFAYPAELGEVSLDVHAVPRGSTNCCAWSMTFSRFDGLVFGGASLDLRDSSPWALGFKRGEDGRFLNLSTLFPEGGSPMDVVEVLQVNGRDILMLEEGGASLNLAGSEFPGGGVWVDTTRLPVETFRAILSTIRVWPPTVPAQTSEP